MNRQGEMCIEIINNKAMHNLINLKYRQMVFRSVVGAVVVKGMHNRQREIS